MKNNIPPFQDRWYCIRHDKHITKEKWENSLCYQCFHKKRVAIGILDKRTKDEYGKNKNTNKNGS